MREKKRKYLLPPCPSYDVEGMESWLCDMAKEGWLLAEDGFFCGIAAFERNDGKEVRYRLEPAEKKRRGWLEDSRDPDPEAMELNQKYNWSYVARRGEFYIYRTFEPGTRELNTDPMVQALALNSVKKRQVSTVISIVLWITLYLGLTIYSGIFLIMIHMKTWVFLFGTFLVMWIFADLLAACISLSRFERKLRQGEFPQTKNWKKKTKWYYGKHISRFILIAVFAGIMLHGWSVSVLNEDKIQLDQYTGDLPFASMREFAGDEDYSYRMTMFGMDLGFNTIRQWSDWLSPQCIDYQENAQIVFEDGKIMDGGLSVHYYETINSFLAQRVAEEIYRADGREKGFAVLETPNMDADFVAAYMEMRIFPTVLIRKNNIVIRASFYQLSSTGELELEEWAKIMGDSVQG